MSASTQDPTVTLFTDQADEVARVLTLFTDFVDACGDKCVEDLAGFCHGKADATCIGWIAETLTWAETMARHLNQAAAAARTHAEKGAS